MQTQQFQPRYSHQNFHTIPVNISPRGNSTNNIFYNLTIESPKNTNAFNETKMLLTSNSKHLNLRKYTTNTFNGFTTMNMNTNSSKNLTINSTTSSKLPVSTYISCSTLQSGIASYSIPKAKRFKNSYKPAYCDTIYNLPDYKSTVVSIGNSVRKDLFDKNKANIPSTHDYVFTSLFDDNLNKKRGYSIAGKHLIKVLFYIILKIII